MILEDGERPMSKLKKQRLDQMIEIALSYKQEVKELKNTLFNRLRVIILKPNLWDYFCITYYFLRLNSSNIYIKKFGRY